MSLKVLCTSLEGYMIISMTMVRLIVECVSLLLTSIGSPAKPLGKSPIMFLLGLKCTIRWSLLVKGRCWWREVMGESSLTFIWCFLALCTSFIHQQPRSSCTKSLDTSTTSHTPCTYPPTKNTSTTSTTNPWHSALPDPSNHPSIHSSPRSPTSSAFTSTFTVHQSSSSWTNKTSYSGSSYISNVTEKNSTISSKTKYSLMRILYWLVVGMASMCICWADLNFMYVFFHVDQESLSFV